MNILLTAINAKYIHSNLAVYSLRACAGEYRDAVELAEYTINNQKDYILEELYKRKPDVLCFSCYIWNIDYVTDIAREKNAGWRIDYFITSKRINDKLQKAAIHTDVLGSDHCPVEVDIEL